MDYGTNNNTLANTVTQTARAFTGHEQIAELSGLIHMNARVYDSDIGRFLSADTVIQDPHDSQAYNRYSYVRNNPLVFTDPSGHSWFSKLWKKIKNIVIGVVVAVLAVYTAGAVLGWLGYASVASATALGGTTAFLASVSGTTALLISGAAAGFVAGVAGGLLSGASLGASLKAGFQGALWGAVGAGVASAIGGAGFGAGLGGKAGRALAHGLTRAGIAKAQGGKWSAGFWSGFAGSALGGLSNYAKSFGGKMAISAIVGGTASRLGGGKFANGAVSAAFVHMYNAMSHPTYPSKENFIEGFTKDVSRAYRALSMMVRSNGFGARGLSSLSYSQAYDRVLSIEASGNAAAMTLAGLGLIGIGSVSSSAYVVYGAWAGGAAMDGYSIYQHDGDYSYGASSFMGYPITGRVGAGIAAIATIINGLR